MRWLVCVAMVISCSGPPPVAAPSVEPNAGAPSVVEPNASIAAPSVVAPAKVKTATIDCNGDPAVVYCAHVSNPCCSTDGQPWVCNNAVYLDWFRQRCSD